MAIGGVVINFTARTADAVKQVGKLTRELGDVDGKAKKAGNGLKRGLAGAAGIVGGALAGAGAALVSFADAAVADAAAAGRLEKVLKNVTKSTDAQVAAVEDWITTQGIAKGIADDKLRPALARLVRSTKDVGEAQELATLAMDIAAATGKDYESVAATLAKANDGQVTALKKLGISLGQNAERAQEYNKELNKLTGMQEEAQAALSAYGPASEEYKKAMEKVRTQQGLVNSLAKEGIDWQKELASEFKGSAEEQANSVEGTWERIKLVWGEMQEAIGSALIPKLEDLSKWMQDAGNQEKLKTTLNNTAAAAVALADGIGKIAGAIKRVVEWYDKLPSWMKGNPLTGWNPFKNMPTAPRQYPSGDPFNFPRGGSTPPDRRTGGVTINNYYPKPERASDTVARDIRLGRRTGGWD